MENFFAKADPSWWIDEGPYFRAHSQFWFEAVKVISFDTVLDVGCGRGRFATPLAKIGQRLVAADINPRMLSLVRERARTQGIVAKIDCVICDAQYLPFKDESFDLVNLVGTFIHIPDQQKTLNEVAHVTKKGGYTAIDHTNYFSLRFFWDGMRYNATKIVKLVVERKSGKRIFCKYCNLWSFKRMVHDAGLSFVSVTGFQIIPFLPVFGLEWNHDARCYLIPFNLAQRINRQLRKSALIFIAYNILVIAKKR